MDKISLPERSERSEATETVLKSFSDEMTRARLGGPDYVHNPPPPEAAPNSVEDYRETCHEMLKNVELLPEQLVQKRITYIEQDSKLDIHFPPGHKCCPVIVPFSNYGHRLSTDDIEYGYYLDTFIIDPNGATINGFSYRPSFVSKLLPAEVQEIAFEIPDDREQLAEKYREACQKLRELLG